MGTEACWNPPGVFGCSPVKWNTLLFVDKRQQLMSAAMLGLHWLLLLCSWHANFPTGHDLQSGSSPEWYIHLEQKKKGTERVHVCKRKKASLEIQSLILVPLKSMKRLAITSMTMKSILPGFYLCLILAITSCVFKSNLWFRIPLFLGIL